MGSSIKFGTSKSNRKAVFIVSLYEWLYEASGAYAYHCEDDLLIVATPPNTPRLRLIVYFSIFIEAAVFVYILVLSW